MSRKRTVKREALAMFPAFRDFEKAFIETNDAVMALLIGSRLGAHTLGLANDTSTFLSEAFPAVPDVRRLDRRTDDAVALISTAERHLAYLAVPFILSVYGSYAEECIRLIDPERALSPEKLSELHTTLDELTKRPLPTELVSMFDILRQVRNRLIHNAATQGSHLRSAVAGMPSAAKESWIRLAGRSLSLESSSSSLELGSNEITLTLAIAKNLAREINVSLQQTLEPLRWAEIVVDDFATNTSRSLHDPTSLRRLSGFANHHYRSLGLTLDDLRGAVALQRSE